MRRVFAITGAALLGSGWLLLVATLAALRPIPERLDPPPGEVARAIVLDRHGQRLASTYENYWNLHDRVRLFEVPPLLVQAILEAEDRRFFTHAGVDWRARGAALWQNLRAGRPVRGASTISEQSARMLLRRKRGLWSRWLMGFEAQRLEAHFSKGEILEFYLNQVPYARQRRGVVQAARDLFDRNLDTLDPSELLVLATLPRSPSRLDPRNGGEALARAVHRLGERMLERGLLREEEGTGLVPSALALRSGELAVNAPHFVRHVRTLPGDGGPVIESTLDGTLQAFVQEVLDQRIAAMSERGVTSGAVLVIDHHSGDVLAWVNGGAQSEIDSVLIGRQPGSTLKPFVYALALEEGMTAATLLDDSPMLAPVGSGLHRYRNYSRRYRGATRLREALGNSLNIPAVRVMEGLAPEKVVTRFRALGLESLAGHSSHYGAGLALGNGEVTLFELVSAYATLARGGVREPLRLRRDAAARVQPQRLFSAPVTSLIGDILSDPEARAAEFGHGGILDFPVQTAIKTGTSNAYRDAWAVAFSERHTAGVWLGNLDRGEMLGVTGAVGPAFVLRSVFSELSRRGAESALPLSRELRRVRICATSGAVADATCPALDEWFRPRHAPTAVCPIHGVRTPTATPARLQKASLLRPTPGLHLAMDPRIPDELERFAMEIESAAAPERVEWFVDGERVAQIIGGGRRYLWTPSRGAHRAFARVFVDALAEPIETEAVVFHVR